MGITKILLLLALVFGVIWIRNLLLNNSRDRTDKGGEKASEDMVQCRYCETHIPRSETTQSDDGFFCSEAHKKAFEKISSD